MTLILLINLLGARGGGLPKGVHLWDGLRAVPAEPNCEAVSNADVFVLGLRERTRELSG
jgi:hypothetical protein